MKMVKVRILDAELEAALLNPEVAKEYDEGVTEIARIYNGVKEGDSWAEIIKNQCDAVINFVDNIFGEGSAKEVFGEETDLFACMNAYRDIINLYNEQVAPQVKEYRKKIGAKQ